MGVLEKERERMARGLTTSEEQDVSRYLEYFIKHRGIKLMCVKSHFINWE